MAEAGVKVYPRGGKGRPGVTTGSTRRCSLEGCTGTRIGVRWPDGKLTWPCLKGMVRTRRGYRIL